MPRDRRGPGLAAWLLASAGLGLAGWVMHSWTPPDAAGSAFCLSRRLFHLPCPGCGLTRAFFLLAKGEWRQAFAMHPVAPLLALEMAVAWIAWGLKSATRWRPPSLRGLLERLASVHAALLVFVWLGRAATGTLPW